MGFLLLNVLILVLVSTAAVLAYVQVLQLRRADEWLAEPSVDYAALHAQWERERHARHARGAPALLERGSLEIAHAAGGMEQTAATRVA